MTEQKKRAVRRPEPVVRALNDGFASGIAMVPRLIRVSDEQARLLEEVYVAAMHKAGRKEPVDRWRTEFRKARSLFADGRGPSAEEWLAQYRLPGKVD